MHSRHQVAEHVTGTVSDVMQFFEKEGCKMVNMSCEEHDRQAASTQFITHTVGRVLGAMELQATPIDTRQASSTLTPSLLGGKQ